MQYSRNHEIGSSIIFLGAVKTKDEAARLIRAVTMQQKSVKSAAVVWAAFKNQDGRAASDPLDTIQQKSKWRCGILGSGAG
jgi:3-methyladenine DNA glycosylase/8-oxoguanine DNA glycosylase